MKIVIESPDWELLRVQKQTILDILKYTEDGYPWGMLVENDNRSLEGILHFIDSIQDNAVNLKYFTEEQVFGSNKKVDDGDEY